MGTVKVTNLPIKSESALRLSFGVRAQTEMMIWYVDVFCLFSLLFILPSQMHGHFVQFTIICSSVNKTHFQLNFHY